MTKHIPDHAIIGQLIVLNQALKHYLDLRKAKGYMQDAETVQLRNDLFNLNASYRKQHGSLANLLPQTQFIALKECIQAVSAAAVCLLSGRRDCDNYVSVDTVRLESCLSLIEQEINTILKLPPTRISS